MPLRSRPLTPAETKLARSVFGSGLRYERIRLHSGAWWLPTRNIAVAPFGHVYFPANRFCPDFAQRPLIERAWLVHELTHVWQHQNGFPVWFGGSLLALRLGYLKNGRVHLGCAGTRVARCCCVEARYARFQVALVRLGRVGFLLHGFRLECGRYPAAVWQPDGALGRGRAVRCR